MKPANDGDPTPEIFDLRGEVALVTGASSGLGKAFAMMLAGRGAEVVVAARRMPALTELVSDIVAMGGKARALRMDIMDADDIQQAIGLLDKVTILINNAGIVGPPNALRITHEEWRQVYQTNVEGAFWVARAVAERMIAVGGGGSIINIASITGIRPSLGTPAYSSSKAAVIQMTKALAAEWARHGIRVNAIAPGYFETDLSREFLESDYGKKMLSEIPLRRCGQPSELEGPLLLLASRASSYMTGSILTVDGGQLVNPL